MLVLPWNSVPQKYFEPKTFIIESKIYTSDGRGAETRRNSGKTIKITDITTTSRLP